jgi:hypothetical protein
MSQAESVTPTRKETDSLPFNFTNLEVYQLGKRRTLFADWITRDINTLVQQIPEARSWEFYNNNQPIKHSHWNNRYPGAEHVEELDLRYLAGRFQMKNVHWSRSQVCWLYGNNRPVDFAASASQTSSKPPTPTEGSCSSEDKEDASEDEAQVTEILDRTREVLAAAASTLREQSAPPTPQTVPGGLPLTPRPSTSWAGLFPTPTSIPQKSTPPRLPSREPSPSRFRTPSPMVLPVQAPPVQIPPVRNTMSTRPLGAAPDPFDGKADNAENFWTALETYYHLNSGIFDTEAKKIVAALTYFKAGTSAAEWVRERQKAAFAMPGGTNFGTWAEFKKAFSDHFIPAESVLESTKIMHTMHMNQREFNNWYQEWSTHAVCAGVDENTKMFAFRRAINQGLHTKLLGISPQPTTMATLVEKSREFNRLWRVYQKGTTKNNDMHNPRCTRAETTAEEGSSTQINYANLEAATGKISKAEKDRRYKEGKCFYCGEGNHLAKACPLKKSKGKSKFNPRNNDSRRDAKARAVTTQDQDKPDESTSPPYEEQSMVLSHIYPATNRFDVIRPASAPIESNF